MLQTGTMRGDGKIIVGKKDENLGGQVGGVWGRGRSRSRGVGVRQG